MPLSSYFSGQLYRSIDENATTDTSPFTAPLEAQMANNAQWLHSNGGGQSLKAYRSNNNWSGLDLTLFTGIKPHQIHHQPFLLTRGLKRVEIILCCLTTLYDMNVTVGIGSYEESTVITPWPNHVQRTIIVEFPEPIDVEYFVDLTIWANCTDYTDPTTTTPDSIDWITLGKIRFNEVSGQDLTTNVDRCLLLSNEFEGDNTDWTAVDHTRKPPPGPTISTAYMNSFVDFPSSSVMTEAVIGWFSLRSVQVIQHFI